MSPRLAEKAKLVALYSQGCLCCTQLLARATTWYVVHTHTAVLKSLSRSTNELFDEGKILQYTLYI